MRMDVISERRMSTFQRAEIKTFFWSQDPVASPDLADFAKFRLAAAIDPFPMKPCPLSAGVVERSQCKSSWTGNGAQKRERSEGQPISRICDCQH